MIITPTFIILLGIVFLLVWLFLSFVDDRKWLMLLLSILLTPLIYFYLFYPIINVFSSYHHEKHFDEKLWKSKPALRYEMLSNMMTDSLFFYKNKIEIVHLLGESEWFSYNKTIKKHDVNQWNYNLGMKPGAFNDKNECIELIFENDVVIDIRHYQLKTTFD